MIKNLFISDKEISDENTYRCLWKRKNTTQFFFLFFFSDTVLTILMSGSLWLHFFLCWMLFRMLAWCGVVGQLCSCGLCKLHTIEDHVLCHVKSTQKPRNLGVWTYYSLAVLYWRVYSIYRPSTIYFRSCCHPQHIAKDCCCGWARCLVHLLKIHGVVQQHVVFDRDGLA